MKHMHMNMNHTQPMGTLAINNIIEYYKSGFK